MNSTAALCSGVILFILLYIYLDILEYAMGKREKKNNVLNINELLWEERAECYFEHRTIH